MFGFVTTGVKPSHKSFIILPTLLFRFMPQFGDGDGGRLPPPRPGLRLFEVSLLRLRRLRKDSVFRPAVTQPPHLQPQR